MDFDVIVIGAGPGGEVALGRLLHAGKRCALVESELIGGECGYWGCIPSKTLLRAPDIRAEAQAAKGIADPALDWPAARSWKDDMVRHLDDAKQVEDYAGRGVEVLKGAARLDGPGVVVVGDRRIIADHVIVATGSAAVIPPIDGIDQVEVWTNRHATGSLTDIPGRIVIVGGGPVGIESSTYLRRFGAEVTLVHGSDVLINREDPGVGERVRAGLEAEGVEVRTGVHAKGVRRDGEGAVLILDDGAELSADVLMVATGRRPRIDGLGLDSVGITDAKKGIAVDDRCSAGEGLWAIGDVTGVMPFTHVAKYQARIAVDNILGIDRRARYEGIPRVVFSDPEVAAVGLTADQAREQGVDVVSVEVDLTVETARPWTYATAPTGTLALHADRARGVLVGGWAVAPLASEWIHTVALAVRAGVPLEVLADGVPQFPTFSEALIPAVERLLNS